MLRQYSIFARQQPSLTLARFLATTQTQSQKTDPIQQLFLDKIREYAQKEKSQKDTDSLVDASAEQQKAFQAELERVGRTYGVDKPETLREFPKIEFKEPLYAVEMPTFDIEFPEKQFGMVGEEEAAASKKAH